MQILVNYTLGIVAVGVIAGALTARFPLDAKINEFIKDLKSI